MKFRNDINALRAFAVIFVIFYHFKVPYFSGGFAGVDIFFVISGYLMSKIILKGFEKSSFSLIVFYKKRFVRIVPTLLVLIVAVQLLGSIFLWPSEHKLLSKYAISSELFLSNIYYWLNSGYFDPSSDTNPLLHSWSLSVEWQFYMIYPLLLLLIKKLFLNNRKVFSMIIIAALAVSFAVSIWLGNHHPSFAFYMFPARSWEMLIGCLIVLYEDRFVEKVPTNLRNILSIISLTTMGVFIFTYDSNYSWPNWPSLYTLIPVVSASVLILCNTPFTLFKNKIIGFFGKISYSLYLWHWPLFVIASSLGFKGVYFTIILLAVVILISYASYKYIETNKNLFFSLKRRLLIPLIVIGFSVIMGSFHINKLFINDKTLELADYKEGHLDQITDQFNVGKCFFDDSFYYEDFSNADCIQLSDSKKNVLLMGDSHAAEFSLSLKNALNLLDMNLIQATTSYCFPLLNSNGREENVKLTNYILKDFIPENSTKIDLVIISANWSGGQGYSNDDLKVKIIELIDYFKQNNIKVKIIGQTENYSLPFPAISSKKIVYKYIDMTDFINIKSYDTNEFLKSFIPKEIYIDVYNLLNQKVSPDYIPYMFDKNHLTLWGADEYLKLILNEQILK
ncbi:acyltransferase family protein [Algibacter sp. L1A34]|uniref:acyltransferase family protein n=1 Tax=Algibacter sp. L1A34 TaxID=2686365 RepID=UPI00131E35B9|nr:acyltransferase family protein [Algibacter sp. L1A34]